MTLHGAFYVDLAPSFRCRTSSLACARTTNAVVHLMRRKGHKVMCYLDDFLGIVATPGGDTGVPRLPHITARLGLELSLPKCVLPSIRFRFRLRFHTWWTYQRQSWLSTRWQAARKASLKDLQRLIRKMQHITKCVHPASRFLESIFVILQAASFTSRHMMHPDIVLDMEWFHRYAAESNSPTKG